MENYGQRWVLSHDPNGDGSLTVTDVAHWLEYLFFAPGDALIFLASRFRAAETFFELSPASYSGWISGITSFAAWFVILWGFDQIPQKPTAKED